MYASCVTSSRCSSYHILAMSASVFSDLSPLFTFPPLTFEPLPILSVLLTSFGYLRRKVRSSNLFNCILISMSLQYLRECGVLRVDCVTIPQPVNGLLMQASKGC